jgi:hypothetical protein
MSAGVPPDVKQLEADVRGAEALEHGPNLAVYGQGRATVRPA